jgi:phospholipid-binding lipoprotein MlaA
MVITAGCSSVSGPLDPNSSAASVSEPLQGDRRLAAAPPVGSGDGAPASHTALGEGAPPAAWTQVESPFSPLYTTDAELAFRTADSRADIPAGVGPPPAQWDAGRRPSGETAASDSAGMAQARDKSIDEAEPEDYDPWEPFNEKMFTLNYNIDRYVLKPAANVYRHIMPEPWQYMISNGFDNIRYPARLVNHVLQGRFWGAFIETSRFLINSTLGVGGLFNPATDYFGIPKSRADFGQTLYRWGVGAGPYFVPPFLPPATVRDFIGRMADSAINPIAWFLIDFWPEGISLGIGEMLNERAINYEAFQGVEETTLDLYTAVRDGYMRRRELQLKRDVE